MRSPKRIIVLEHIKSDNIEQAIIIVRENARSTYSSIVKEAEHIVSSYAKKLNHLGTTPVNLKLKKQISMAFWTIVAACLCFFGIVIFFILPT